MKQRTALGLLVSLGLHAAVLGWWRVHEAGMPGGAADVPAGRVMEVRLMQHAPPMPQPAPAPLQNAGAKIAATDAPAPWSGPRAEDGATGHVPSAPSAPALAEMPAGLPVLQEAPYLPSRQLDTPPTPATPVIVPFPDAALDQPQASIILILFIGESGRVDRVEVDESVLPPEFEKAAIDAFLLARMQPGIKDGRPSRARMKVQVDFELR